MTWLTGWDYRKSHTVNSATGAGINYSIKIKTYWGTFIGKEFERYENNPFDLPGDDSGYGTPHPDVLYFPAGEDGYKYWMYYEKGITGIDNEIYLVRSNDGLNWTEAGISNPILDNITGEEHIPDPDVIKVGSTWYMFLGRGLGAAMQIYRLTSSDGKSWSDPQMVIDTGGAGAWDEDGVLSPTVIYEDGTFYLWYTGEDAEYYQTGLATSTNGIDFTKDAGNPVFSPEAGEWDSQAIWHIQVVKLQDHYRLYYNGDDGSPWTYPIGLATSSDKTNWVRYSGNPIMTKLGTGWEADRLYRMSVLQDISGNVVLKDGDMWLYYSAGAGAYYKIGLATSGISLDTIDNLNGKCRTDFGDLRFTKDDGITELDYWIQEKTDSDYAIFWVEIPDDLSSIDRIIYVYYGNSTATYPFGNDQEKMDNVFLLADQFYGDSLDASKWTEELKGTGASIVVSGGECKLNVPDDQICSANIKSITTFQNGVAIHIRRKEPDDNEYIGFSLGSGTLCAGPNGGTADWWFTTVHSSYYWVYEAYAGGYTSNEIMEMPPSGGWIHLTDEDINLGSLVNIYAIWQFSYLSDGKLKYIVNDIERASVIDTTFLNDNKFILITQGAYSLAERGAPTFVDWVFVRKCVDPEPSHGSWGSEEEGFYIISISCDPISVQRTNVNTTELRCDFHDGEDLNISRYLCDFYLIDPSSTQYGPYSALITKEGSKEYNATLDFDIPDGWSLGDYDIKAEVYKR